MDKLDNILDVVLEIFLQFLRLVFVGLILSLRCHFVLLFDDVR